MRIGIFGGSFNPPHVGHTESARAAVAQLGFDRLLVIPSGTPPHKELAAGSPSSEARFEMTQLAFSNIPNVQILDTEIRRAGESYTVDTIRELRREFPKDEFFMFVGTDMLLTLRQWKDSEELLREITPVVSLRSDDDRAAIAEEVKLLEGLGVRTEVLTKDAIEISSSQLRRALPERELTWHLDASVYSYIIGNRLYGVRANFDWLRLQAYLMLGTERIRHVAGCESEAVRLAERWGADVDSAREAAILHDITKRLSLAEQLAICGENVGELDEQERKSAKLLHAKSAAFYAAEKFGVSDEVKSAVMWHTTGREDMTMLEKIIYMADYIEPNRSFEGVEYMRQLAYTDIDAAMLCGMQMSIDDLTARGIVPHPSTLGAVRFLRKGL